MKPLCHPYLTSLITLSLVSLSACGEDPAPVPSAPPSAAASTAPAAPAATPASNTVAVETGPCGAYSATDNMLTNGDFEAPSIIADQEVIETGKQFTNWKVDAGSITIFSSNSLTKPSGNQVLGFAGTLSQTVSTIPGKTYLLSFCYATAPGAASGGLALNWNGQNLATLPLDAPGSAMTWKGVKITLPPPSASLTTISLNGQSALIDTIKITIQP
ncbi:MAG: hypothetical protein CVV27_12825 [Candidatus Melainabacteria bacterium HGW-Melainabacteria-1]|nr:MAG: hypothetical protein CVV27_12825 [Candidatus Melainabacteria bacterium HGW-Melainabacteria-1]